MSLIFKPLQTGLRWLPALSIALVIFTFSSIPGEQIGQSYDRLAGRLPTSTPTPTQNPASTAVQAPAPTLPVQPVSPTAQPLLPVLVAFPGLDWLKIGHALGYFWLGSAVLFALPKRSRWSPSIALLLCLLYSVSDEIHQLFVPGRSASSRDILIDTLAALAGVAFLLGGMAIRLHFNRKRAPAG